MIHYSRHSTHHTRRGYSMMEMIIVMTVLAGMAAVSWPMLQSPLSKIRLQAAAQEVSSELAKARLKAMQSGVAQVFRIQMRTGKFQVTAAIDDEDSEIKTDDAEQTVTEVADLGDDQHSPLTEPSDLIADERELPEGICFSCPSHDEQTASADSELPAEEEIWTNLAIFYPNGDTTNAVVGLRGERDMQVDVKLSSLTGIAKIGEAHRQELR